MRAAECTIRHQGDIRFASICVVNTHMCMMESELETGDIPRSTRLLLLRSSGRRRNEKSRFNASVLGDEFNQQERGIKAPKTPQDTKALYGERIKRRAEVVPLWLGQHGSSLNLPPPPLSPHPNNPTNYSPRPYSWPPPPNQPCSGNCCPL